MSHILAKMKDIEDEMNRTQKNKATAGHLGLLKARLAKLKRDLMEGSGGSGGGRGEGFDVRRGGAAARIGMVGFPSVGKSSLLNKLTPVDSAVSAIEFTTLTCVPGTKVYRGAVLQFLDLPGIVEKAAVGRGRGKQVLSTARSCDIILVVLDALSSLEHKTILEKEMHSFGLRINQEPPRITFRRKEKGGISFTNMLSHKPTHLNTTIVTSVLKEYRILSADIVIHEDATVDQLIDVVESRGRVYVPALYVMNKMDALAVEELEIIARLPDFVPISANSEWNLDGLLEAIWSKLSLIRVYTKPKGEDPDFNEPVILKGDKGHCTVEHFCGKIHKSLLEDFKTAVVWGTSTKFSPQRVGKKHLLHDEDVVQVIKK